MEERFHYDVFLSFRGADTRNSFTSHLYEALKQQFQVFHDTSLPRGHGIAPQLSEAIRESQIYVVVFSPRYADSKWCLDELSQIMMHCKHTNHQQQIILPVFLDVPNAPLEQLLTRHQTIFDAERVQKWREALHEVGRLTGLHLQDDANGNEYELVNQIVEKIKTMLQPDNCLNVAGIESRVQQVISLLNMGSDDDVGVVVIRGPAGIGKTTIAKATYERLALHFKARWRYSCFLSDVKTVFGEPNGRLTLQKKLLSNLVQNDESRKHIHNYHQGIPIIEKMIKNQKLLLVLDDVDDEKQLEILGMNRAILGHGSRIIVTTREDSNVVERFKPYATHEPQLLDENESLEVFCMDAFGEKYPKEGYGDASREAVCLGAGCPGVLKDLAVYMRHYQSVEQWGCALRYVKQNPSYLKDGFL